MKAPVASAPLSISSNPPGAEVYIDNDSKGKTPVKLSLIVGKHEVRLTLPNYHEWKSLVQLTEEIETPLSIRLSPLEEK